MRGEKGEEMLPVTHLPSLPVARCRAEDGRKESWGRKGKEREEDTANKTWEVAGREFNPEWNDRDSFRFYCKVCIYLFLLFLLPWVVRDFLCQVTLVLVTIIEQRKKGTDQNELYELSSNTHSMGFIDEQKRQKKRMSRCCLSAVSSGCSCYVPRYCNVAVWIFLSPFLHTRFSVLETGRWQRRRRRKKGKKKPKRERRETRERGQSWAELGEDGGVREWSFPTTTSTYLHVGRGVSSSYCILFNSAQSRFQSGDHCEGQKLIVVYSHECEQSWVSLISIWCAVLSIMRRICNVVAPLPLNWITSSMGHNSVSFLVQRNFMANYGAIHTWSYAYTESQVNRWLIEIVNK